MKKWTLERTSSSLRCSTTPMVGSASPLRRHCSADLSSLPKVFINWAQQVRNAGITIPIVPGIMPIQTFASFQRRTAFSKTIVPPSLLELLEPIRDDDKKVRELGTKFVGDMCRKILNAGLNIHGIHICKLSRLRGGAEIWS